MGVEWYWARGKEARVEPAMCPAHWGVKRTMKGLCKALLDQHYCAHHHF